MNRFLDPEQVAMVRETFEDEFEGVLQDFLADLEVLLTTLRVSYTSGEVEQVRKVAHQIKGTAANFGFLEVSRIAAEVESQAKQGAIYQASEALEEALRGSRQEMVAHYQA